MRGRWNKEKKRRTNGVGREGIAGEEEVRGIKMGVTIEKKMYKKKNYKDEGKIEEEKQTCYAFRLEAVRIQQIRKPTQVSSELMRQVSSVRYSINFSVSVK
jgi:hypothetical protein